MGLIKELETVQHQFLKFGSINFNIYREEHSLYGDITQYHKFKHLRNKKEKIKFIFFCMNYLII